MKIDCGELREEKKARLEQWHTWFAWWPRRIGAHDCRWLEYVERRGKHYSTFYRSFWVWVYRARKQEKE